MESPGTAPGSEPCIMGAFIAIVRVAPDKTNIGRHSRRRKASGRVGFHPTARLRASRNMRPVRLTKIYILLLKIGKT